jgi:hypothetical protein
VHLSVFKDEDRKETNESRKGTREIVEATSGVEVKVNLYHEARADVFIYRLGAG